MGNSQVEHFNRTLGSVIRALPPKTKGKWPKMLQTLTFAYNCTAHESTDYAPFFLMFGRVPRLPVDEMFSSVERDNEIADYDRYVKRLRNDLKEALAVAQKNTEASQKHQAEFYNQKTKGRDIEVGDQVLLANKGEHGRRKLADRWESIPYRVVALNPQCHTFLVCNTSTGQEKTVHQNLLLQANFLPLELEEAELLSVASSESNNVSPDVACPRSDLSANERVAHWVECTDVSEQSQQGLTIRSSSNGSLDQESIKSVDEVDEETSEKGSLSSCATSGLASDPDPSIDYVSPTRIAISPRNHAATGIRTRVGRMVKPVSRLIENMSQSMRTIKLVGGVMRSLLDVRVK